MNNTQTLAQDVIEYCRSINYVRKPHTEAAKIALANMRDEEYEAPEDRWYYLVEEIEPESWVVMAYDNKHIPQGPVSPVFRKKSYK
jgi:hypothetical protein